MKHLLLFLFGILCFQPATDNPKSRKAVFIIVDGIPADVIEKVATPAIDEISRKGGYSRAYVGGVKGTYNETPTISAPGYMNLVTGTWANKHNVVGNYKQSPNYHYQNIFRIAKKSKPGLETAIFSTWKDNRTVLIGEGRQETGFFAFDFSFDGLEKDTLRYPHDKKSEYIKNIDRAVSEKAAAYITESAPDLSWVYLQYTDDVGHRYGDSPEFNNAIEYTDGLVGKTWEAVKKREKEHNEEWLIVVTTDHGRDKITGKSHGKQTPRERATWIAMNQPPGNPRFKNNDVAVVDILPSILDFLKIDTPKEVQRELDGISFMRPSHIEGLTATYANKKVHLKWSALAHEGYASAYLAFTNDYATGGRDEYILVKDNINVMDESIDITLGNNLYKKLKGLKMIKLVLESPSNTLNYWIQL